MKVNIKDFISTFIIHDTKEMQKTLRTRYDANISSEKLIKNRLDRELSFVYEVERDSGLLLIFNNCDNEHYESVDMDRQIDLSNKVYLYDLCGHTGDWLIEEFKSLSEAKEYIESPKGLLNMFTTCVYVMKNGKIINYKFDEEKGVLEWI